MMAMIVQSVLAITGMPDGVSQKLVLRLLRPVVVLERVLLVQSLYFLQKDQVRVQVPQAVPQIMHRQTAIELRESFVDIVGNQRQRVGHNVPIDRKGRQETSSMRSMASLAAAV